jgi:hypothetical protein
VKSTGDPLVRAIDAGEPDRRLGELIECIDAQPDRRRLGEWAVQALADGLHVAVLALPDDPVRVVDALAGHALTALATAARDPRRRRALRRIMARHQGDVEEVMREWTDGEGAAARPCPLRGRGRR